MAFRLNESVEVDSIRRKFEADGYVHVPQVLPGECANRIRQAMLDSTPWNLVFNDRGKHYDLTASQVSSMSPEKLRDLQNAIYNQARDQFQYCFNNYPIYDMHKAGRNTGHVLHRFYEWMSGDEFIGFARSVTGHDDISYVDAQATRYRTGHFLTTHDDAMEGKNRRAAYIFNFTPDWRPDWGGYLLLLDDGGHVCRGFRPTHNTLNILSIPQRHNVSIVAPFAAGMRLAVSGWLRYGESE